MRSLYGQKCDHADLLPAVPSVTTLNFRRPPSVTTFNFSVTTLSCTPGVVVFCFEIRGCFSGVRMVPYFGLFFRSCRACPCRTHPNDPARCRERILIQGFFTPPTSHVTNGPASRSPTYVFNRKLSAYKQSLKRKRWLYEAVCASMVRYA